MISRRWCLRLGSRKVELVFGTARKISVPPCSLHTRLSALLDRSVWGFMVLWSFTAVVHQWVRLLSFASLFMRCLDVAFCSYFTRACFYGSSLNKPKVEAFCVVFLWYVLPTCTRSVVDVKHHDLTNLILQWLAERCDSSLAGTELLKSLLL